MIMNRKYRQAMNIYRCKLKQDRLIEAIDNKDNLAHDTFIDNAKQMIIIRKRNVK